MKAWGNVCYLDSGTEKDHSAVEWLVGHDLPPRQGLHMAIIIGEEGRRIPRSNFPKLGSETCVDYPKVYGLV